MFSTLRAFTAAVLLIMAMAAQTAGPEITPEAVWSPDEPTLGAVQRECASNPAADLPECFAAAMERHGATAAAVAFTRAQKDVQFIRELQEAGAVDIASVTWPFRANETNGVLLVNGSPSPINVDNLMAFPLDKLKSDPDYAQVVQAHPNALLISADRSSASVIDLDTSSPGGVRFGAEYRVTDGCRACATLGHARFGFDFRPDGTFKEICFIAFAAAGPEGAEVLRNPPAPLDMSSAPELIRVLYDATRQSKESQTLIALARAQTLIEQRQGLLALGPQKRTALHWVVFGAASETKPKPLAVYEELAAELIEAGVDVNQEDQYQNTALDYLDYSPNHQMHTLLLEHGAVSGYFTGNLEERFVDLFQQVEAAAHSGKISKLQSALAADLEPGQSIPSGCSRQLAASAPGRVIRLQPSSRHPW